MDIEHYSTQPTTRLCFIQHVQKSCTYKKGVCNKFLQLERLCVRTFTLRQYIASVFSNKTGTPNHNFMALALLLCWRDQRAEGIMRSLQEVIKRPLNGNIPIRGF